MSFKKITLLALIMAAIMICSCLVCSADIGLDVSESEVKINLDFGEGVAGKKLAIEVFNPSKDLSGIASADSEALMEVFAFVAQTTADAEGKAEITYTPTGKSGWYTVKAGYENCEEYESERFVYVRQKDTDDLLAALRSATDASAIKNVFADPTDDSLAGYVILALDETEAYEIFDSASAAVKESIYKVLFARAEELVSTDDMKQIFSEAVFSEKLFSINDTGELKDYIEDYADVLGFADSDIYNGIYLNNTLCGSKTKTKVLKAITEYEWTDDAKADVVGTCEEIIFLTALYNENVYDRIGDMIEAAEEMLIANGANLDDMEDVTSKTDVYRSIAGEEYSDIDAFVSKLNDAIDDNSKDSDKKDNKKKTSGGGGSGSGTNMVIPGNVAAATPPDELESRFTDLENVGWAVDAIEYLAEQGIVQGKSENLFYPEAEMTRAEFAKVLVLSFDILDKDAKADFTDVKPDDWYYPYVASAYEKGIINGYGDSFGAGDPITRQDMATIVCRAMEATGMKVEAIRDYNGFADEDRISDYALEGVKTLYSAGIINGMDDDHFAPLNYATRAQVAKIIYGLLVGQEG